MTLTAGARLGPYEVQAVIGTGGMGEVYKANDTRLDRVVAIKVLPSHIASDPTRRERFETPPPGLRPPSPPPGGGEGPPSTGNKAPLSWSSDGRFLLFNEIDPKTNYDLWTLPLMGDGKPSPWLNTPFAETLGQFSPDGRWVAYQSNESGAFEIYVQPFPAANAKWQISTGGGSMPRWRADGKELVLHRP